MRVTFLGIGGVVPTVVRASNASFVNHGGERLLFDCREGTQHQVTRCGIRLGVSHLFITHPHGDHILDIPGPIQTLDFNDCDNSPTIRGLPRSKGHLEQLVHAGGYQPGFHVSAHEIQPGDITYYADGYEVRAFGIGHRTTSVGYALVRDDRPGRFDHEKAGELGVLIGPTFGRLRAGEDVELENGIVVCSEQVVGGPRPGRIVVYTGDTRPLNSAVEVTCDADLLIYDATFTDEEAERAKQTTHLTAWEAARVARDTNVRRSALMHISARHVADPSPLLEQTREVYDNEAFVVKDDQKLEVPYVSSDGGGAEIGE